LLLWGIVAVSARPQSLIKETNFILKVKLISKRSTPWPKPNRGVMPGFPSVCPHSSKPYVGGSASF